VRERVCVCVSVGERDKFAYFYVSLSVGFTIPSPHGDETSSQIVSENKDPTLFTYCPGSH